MGEHKFNPMAQAAAHGRPVQLMDIGEGYALAGVGVQPFIHTDEDGNRTLAIVVVALGGKPSQLMPQMAATQVVLGEVGRMPLAGVHALIDAGLAKGREAAQ